MLLSLSSPILLPRVPSNFHHLLISSARSNRYSFFLNSNLKNNKNNYSEMPPKRKSATAVASPAKKQSKISAFVAGDGAAAAKDRDNDTSFEPAQLVSDPEWLKLMNTEFAKPYFTKIKDQLVAEYTKGKQVFPVKKDIFAAFNLTPLKDVKVVILGQDPYHDDRQAHGLCFSVQRGIKTPPSLVNIYKELTTDIKGFKTPNHGNLECWAKQGVLLINATLTVQAHQANSHSKFGWQQFTDAVIRMVSTNCPHVVFILWGGFAQKKEKLIDATKHTIIKAAHPSPLSVTKFLGCKCFSATNTALSKYGLKEIDWSVPN